MFNRSILLGVSSDDTDAVDGSIFASVSFDRAVLERLKDRVQCFLRAKEAYPDLYETCEFHGLLQWFGMGGIRSHGGPPGRCMHRRGSFDADLGEHELSDESLRAGLEKLGAQKINSLVVPAEVLLGTGKVPTECDRLVMSLCGDSLDMVDLRWFCHIKHTDIAMRTTEINSEDIDRWLAVLLEEGSPDGIVREVAFSGNDHGAHDPIAHRGHAGYASVDEIEGGPRTIARERR